MFYFSDEEAANGVYLSHQRVVRCFILFCFASNMYFLILNWHIRFDFVPPDVDVPHPDEKSIITYVSSLYDVMPRVDAHDGVRANVSMTHVPLIYGDTKCMNISF